MTTASRCISGTGIHTGRSATLHIEPTHRGGIRFRTPNGDIPARFPYVDRAARRCTTLRNPPAILSTVEHLMAALIHLCPHCIVHLDGPEIPALDGSAAAFVDLLTTTTQNPQERPPFFAIHRPITLHHPPSEIRVTPIEPDEPPQYTVQLEYTNVHMGSLTFTYVPGSDRFATDLAPARTYALERDVAAIRNAGLGKGGDLSCALIIGDTGPLNPEGKRFDNEPARHKMLDLIGDLALLGALPHARIRVTHPGHRIHHHLAEVLWEEAHQRIDDTLKDTSIPAVAP